MDSNFHVGAKKFIILMRNKTSKRKMDRLINDEGERERNACLCINIVYILITCV